MYTTQPGIRKARKAQYEAQVLADSRRKAAEALRLAEKAAKSKPVVVNGEEYVLMA